MTVRRVATSGGTRYEVRVDVPQPDGTRLQVKRRFRTKAEATAAETDLRADAKSGAFAPKSSTTVRDYLQTWLAGRIDVRSTTRSNYRTHLVAVVKAYGDLPVQQLTKVRLDRLVADMTTAGRAPATVKTTLMVLSMALDDAVAERLLQDNPVRHVKRPKADERVKSQAWTREQAQTFVEAAQGTREAALWWLSLCGLRRGEVLGLMWDDVDLDAATVHVQRARVLDDGHVVVNGPKTKRGTRTVPLPAQGAAALRAFHRRQAEERLAKGTGPVTGYVAVDKAGRPIRPEAYSDLFDALVRATNAALTAAATGAGADPILLPRIRLHDVRHTAASLLASQQVSPTVAASMLGHDPNVFLRTYAKAYEDDRHAAMDRLGEALSSSGTQ